MIYEFTDCIVDTGTRELRHQGGLRTVEPQVFDLLATLLEHRERVVTRAELIDRVWAGRCVSDAAIDARINAARRAVGDSGKTQSVIRTIPRHGHRFIADVQARNDSPNHVSSPLHEDQRTQFCRSFDGTQIAFARTGSGPPLVRTGHFLTHLEHDWHSPLWRPFLSELGRHFQVTRYDQRGSGLSDRSIKDFSLDRFVEDLEAVVEAAGLDSFVLYAASQGVPVSVAYAVRHPERVRRLILHGGYAQGRMVRGSANESETGEAILTLIRQGWGKPGSAFLTALSSMFIPTGTREQIDDLATIQRQSTNGHIAARLRAEIDRFDVTDLLEKVRVPTLVIHANDDSIHPLEQGRMLATGIPNSEFRMLDSPNHVVLEHEPAWTSFFDAVRAFASTGEQTRN